MRLIVSTNDKKDGCMMLKVNPRSSVNILGGKQSSKRSMKYNFSSIIPYVILP